MRKPNNIKILVAKTLKALAIVSLVASAPAITHAQDGTRVINVKVDKRPIVHPNATRFGAYDPHGDFGKQKNVSTEHLFLPWEDVELSDLYVADEYAFARGRKLLITVEPWSWDLDWRVTSDQLRSRVLNGSYDANMRSIAEIVAKLKSPVIIRWGQEMENKSGRFSWANWRPADYITAYIRMMNIVREVSPKATIMWSPKGEKGLQDYYPGDEHVDIVGLSVFGLQQFDEIEYGKVRSFKESVEQGYNLTVGFGKPIWVAELGYEGGDEYVTDWLKTVTLAFPEYPELKEVVYFNDKEVYPWPHNLGLPEWRVVRNPANYRIRQ